MSFEKKLLADQVVTRLLEGLGIYQFCNRAFDALVRPGATSIDIPKLAIPVVKTTGTSLTDADRKKSKTDTTMVNVPLTPYAVPLADNLAAMFESNGMLIQEFIKSASMAIAEKLDELVLTEAQTTGYSSNFKGATLAWEDITAIVKHFNKYKVPKAGRIIAIPAELSQQFYDIDVIKNAIAFNKQVLETGELVSILGMKFFVSGVVPHVGGKDAIVGIYGPALACVVNKLGEIQEAWDTVNLQKVYDVLAHAGVKLLDEKFSVVKIAN